MQGNAAVENAENGANTEARAQVPPSAAFAGNPASEGVLAIQPEIQPEIKPSLATCRAIVRNWEDLDLEEQVARNRRRLDALVIPYEKLFADPTPLGARGKRSLIFMHIPKCGGTTLEHLIAKNYQVNGVLHINAPALLRNPRAVFKRGVFPRAVMGHHKLNQPLYQLASRAFVHITVLREPVSRTLSYYNYLRTSEGHGKHDSVKGLTLEEFINSDELVELDNAQALRLAGVLRRREIRRRRFGPETLEAAKETLTSRFSLFGLTERYDEFLIMLRRLLGWADIYYQRRNVSKGHTERAEIPAPVLDRIRERNSLDLELYRFASELFQDRCDGLRITADTVARLCEANRVHTEIVQDPLIDRESRIEVEFLDKLARGELERPEVVLDLPREPGDSSAG